MRVCGSSEYSTTVMCNGKREDVGKIITVKITKTNRSTWFGEKVNNLDQKVA